MVHSHTGYGWPVKGWDLAKGKLAQPLSVTTSQSFHNPIIHDVSLNIAPLSGVTREKETTPMQLYHQGYLSLVSEAVVQQTEGVEFENNYHTDSLVKVAIGCIMDNVGVIIVGARPM